MRVLKESLLKQLLTVNVDGTLDVTEGELVVESAIDDFDRMVALT